MLNTDFLVKLSKEGRLSLVEASETITAAYLERSNESLSSAKALLRIGNLKDSVACSYFAMYHSLLALLMRVGIKCENHTAGIILLKEVFGIDKAPISRAKAERIDKQYYIDFVVYDDEVKESIQIAERFMGQMVGFIALLNEQAISAYREKVKTMLERKPPVKALLFDLSRTLLFPVDSGIKGELNPLHAQKSKEDGYDFHRYFRLNTELLNYIGTLKARYRLYIFTTGMIQEAKEIKPILGKLFTRVYSAETLGMVKKDSAAYKHIADDAGFHPSQLVYVDDSQENVDAALKAGLQAFAFKGNDDLIARLQSILTP